MYCGYGLPITNKLGLSTYDITPQLGYFSVY